ncbi:tetratricopeptide repeat protein [Streptomyces sp. NPDC090025]|uniref:tetratricopeptide repeat protein n=1 Tax=Streptomyces sp. NPDC090025 TaxID=3365922 RepID=UPI0038395935
MVDERLLAEVRRDADELRSRAGADPERYLPRLLVCLHGLVGLLTEDPGRYAEATVVLGEAVEHFRTLAARDPAEHGPGLAAALGQRALLLGLLGRRAEALPPAREAVGLLRAAARRDPGQLPDLALALTNLGNQLAELGQHAEALELIREAVAIRRRSADAAGLASALADLGIKLGEMDRKDEAVVTLREAVELFRAGAGGVGGAGGIAGASGSGRAARSADPGQHYATLLALVRELDQLGRSAETAPFVAEAQALRQSLAAADPGVLRAMDSVLRSHGTSVTPDGRFRREPLRTATAPGAGAGAGTGAGAGARRPEPIAPDALQRVHRLNDQALGLVAAGSLDLAAATLRDAVGLCEAHAPGDPRAALALARTLHNLGLTESWRGRHPEAFGAVDEAARLYRRHLGVAPERLRPVLADVLDSLGSRLAALGRHAEALAPAQEAVVLYRALVDRDPDTHLHGLARGLNNLGIRLTDMDRHEDALRAAREVVAVYRRLRADAPGRYRYGMCHALGNLALRLARTGRDDEVLAPTMEALDLLFEMRGPHHPSDDVGSLAESLDWLAWYHRKHGRRAEARKVKRAAAELRR